MPTMTRTTGVMCIAMALLTGAIGCASEQAEDRDFFTSGNREADQRAEQRIAKEQQLRGEGEEGQDEQADAGEGESIPAAGSEQAMANADPTLYERLGGAEGVRAIVDDFVPRVLADPRVNWERESIRQGGLSLNRWDSVAWDPNPQNVQRLKTHMMQFLSLATGGPAQYQGRDMRQVHRGMHISNAEFDASVGDFKATLDKLGVPTDEQKELLSIIESTRPQVVERR